MLVPSLRYVASLTDENGIVEHAERDRSQREDGYCTDDAGRLLGLAARLSDDPEAERLAHASLGFLERAYLGGGVFRLRQRGDGAWTADPSSDDADARALLGLAVARTRAPWLDLRRRAARLFDDAAQSRSEHPRAIAYAALGAAEVLRRQPEHAGAHRLLNAASQLTAGRVDDPVWPWSEERLTYDNAVLPEASLEAAVIWRDARRARVALAQLRWLVERQTLEGHFSFTPVGGADVDSVAPGFDQQPIEAWATASACARAYHLTHDSRWLAAVELAAAWFFGANDVGVVVYDEWTGGAYDGLEAHGVNQNEGAESAMAFVATMMYVAQLRAYAAATA